MTGTGSVYRTWLITKQTHRKAIETKKADEHKCAAVAETGDRLARIDIGRKLGAVPFFEGGGAGSPCNTM